MSVFVDPLFPWPKWNTEGYLWCDMVADTIEELHDFAARMGRKRCWFHGDHYDLTPSFRALAVRLGAIELTARELVEVRRRLSA